MDEGERILITENCSLLKYLTEKLGREPSFERAGPHAKIYHDPSWTRVGILTAGGLCPGLNNVIKGLVEILTFDYGIKTIFGIRFGFAGLIPKFGYEPLMLNPEEVDLIHELGGTVLGSSRGQQPTDEIVDTLVRMNINVLFVIGGDGSLRCARDVAEECLKRGLKISVVGVPKTIDNDLMFVGRSFGFETAVAEATAVIRNAHMEAKGTFNGFTLEGLMAALEHRFASGKTHTVVVVAEGAGQRLIEGESAGVDASGNVLKKDIGEFLKRHITNHFKAKGIISSVKYFDPSYMIRSVPAKGTDAIRCYMLARSAVHAAMAGRTNCVVGQTAEWNTLVPIRLATIERQKVHPKSDLWRSVMDATGQEFYFKGGGSKVSDATLAP